MLGCERYLSRGWSVGALAAVAALWISVASAQVLGGACADSAFLHVPDAGLIRAIHESLGWEFGFEAVGDLKGPDETTTVPCELLARLTRLEAATPHQKVRSLEGLQYATSLEALTLRMIPLPIPGTSEPHAVESLEPLRGLPNLRYVNIVSEGELDLEPLASLPVLEELYLTGVSIARLEALLELEVDTVVLQYAGLTDITALADWERPPGHLGLSLNRIRDLTPLASNPSFDRGHTVDLSYNCVERPAPLSLDEGTSSHPVRVLLGRGVRLILDHQSVRCGAPDGALEQDR